MSDLFVTLDSVILEQAIADLAARAGDLSGTAETAARRFERLIGSEDHPDISRDDQIQRLSLVRSELETVLAAVMTDSALPEISAEAISVLTDYEEAEARARLHVPHMALGPGIPSALLIEAAVKAAGHLEDILEAVVEDGTPPAVTFYEYFMAYEELVGSAEFDEEDDYFFLETSIAYCDAIIANPELAWSGEIEVPVILAEHVLTPCLQHVRATLRLH